MIFGKIGPLEIMIVLLVFLINTIFIVPFWKIFSRVGHPGFYSLGMVVPLLNLILVYYLAFGEWPLLKGKN